MLNFLFENGVLLGLALLILLALLLLGVVISAAVRRETTDSEEHTVSLDASALRKNFKSALMHLESQIMPKAERYKMPWILVLNSGPSVKALPLDRSGLPNALSQQPHIENALQAMHWGFFDQGLAIQLSVDQLLGPSNGSDVAPLWDQFLGMCQEYRPDRPFDSVVVSVPAQLLLEQDAQGIANITEQAKKVHRQLWLAQKRLALNFPVYIVISGCEDIPGFSRYAAALPADMRNSMLGWSNPYELTAPFQSGWIDTGLNSVVNALSEGCAELATVDLSDHSSSDYFLLPLHVDRLRQGLKQYTQELLKSSTYLEPFLFRGFYLSGDFSDAAGLVAQDRQLSLLPEAASDPVLRTLSSIEQSVEGFNQPAFLRDVFQQKVFAEMGLIRPTAAQHMRHATSNIVWRWVGGGVLVIWACGLAYTSWHLNDNIAEYVNALNKIEQENQRRVLAKSGLSVVGAMDSDPASINLADVGFIVKLDARQLRSIFMPGSYSLLADLVHRVQERLDLGLMMASHEPIRRAIVRQVSQLTEVPMDVGTGQLALGASCKTRDRNDSLQTTSAQLTISVENTQQFQQALLFLDQIEKIDQAILAFSRLSSTTSNPQQDDLRIVARNFGISLPEKIDRLTGMFSKIAREQKGLNLDQLQLAAKCQFQQAVHVIHEEIFQDNDLRVSEEAVNRYGASVLGNASIQNGLLESIENLQSLLQKLTDQETLLMPGKGAWMRNTEKGLGQEYEAFLARAARISLIGKPAVEDIRRQTAIGLNKFHAEWSSTQESLKSEFGQIIWSDKEGSWTWTESRQDLRKALKQLLAQPYMSVASNEGLPDLPVQATLKWTNQGLDDVLALANARKLFQNELLPQFPKAFRRDVESIVNQALAQSALNGLSSSLVINPGGAPVAPSSEAERSRLVRIHAMLIDMGASSAAEQLVTLNANDALVRLKLLEDQFNAADIYVTRDRDFRHWDGEKNPMLSAYSANDLGEVQAYVLQQQTRIESLVKEAEPLLNQAERQYPNHVLVRRWKLMVADFERYRMKSPNSHLAALENFVTSTAADIELSNCAEKLGKAVLRKTAGVFSDRLVYLQTSLLSRCRDLKSVEQKDHWSAFANIFNRDMAGRSPFQISSEFMTSNKTASSKLPALVAQPDEVAYMLKAYDKAHKALKGKTWEGRRGVSAAMSNVMRFDEQMEKIHGFLAPLFPVDDNVPAGYDVGIDFRANVQSEIEGNKIIDWGLTIGSQTQRHRDPPKPLRWELGMPVMLTMRVARDGPVTPVGDSSQPALQVSEQTVSFRFADPWALLSLIQAQREPESLSRTDPRSILLRLEFPLVTQADQPKMPLVESRAKVFVRMTINPAGRRQALAWPGSFPNKAPEWSHP